MKMNNIKNILLWTVVSSFFFFPGSIWSRDDKVLMEYAKQELTIYDYGSPNAAGLHPSMLTEGGRHSVYAQYQSLFSGRRSFEELGYHIHLGKRHFLGVSYSETGTIFKDSDEIPNLLQSFIAVHYAKGFVLSSGLVKQFSFGLNINLNTVNQWDLEKHSFAYINNSWHLKFFDSEGHSLIAGCNLNHISPNTEGALFGLGAHFIDCSAYYEFLNRSIYVSGIYNLYGKTKKQGFGFGNRPRYTSYQIVRLGGILKRVSLGYKYKNLGAAGMELKEDDTAWLRFVIHPLQFFNIQPTHNIRFKVDYGPGLLMGNKVGRGTCLLFSLSYTFGEV